MSLSPAWPVGIVMVLAGGATSIISSAVSSRKDSTTISSFKIKQAIENEKSGNFNFGNFYGGCENKLRYTYPT